MDNVHIDLTRRIGLRLRETRKAQGLTLSQLSETTQHLSNSRIGNYEQGQRRMGIWEACELVATLDTVSATYLLCLNDEQFLTDQERNLLEWFRRADERGKETILRAVEMEATRRGAT